MTANDTKERGESRYPWADAPEWAQFAATDKDGSATWYASKPTIDSTDRGWIAPLPPGIQFYLDCAIPGTYPADNWRDSLEPRPAAPVADGLEAQKALGFVYDHFCAMDNGDEPLEAYPQKAVDTLAHAGWAVVPCALPFSVLGEAAMMLDTGNPKFMWDFLIAKTRIYPRCAPDASIAAAYMAATPSAPEPAGVLGDEADLLFSRMYAAGGYTYDEDTRRIARWWFARGRYDLPRPTESRVGEVTDAMVERARQAYEDEFFDGRHTSQDHQRNAAMRAALLAALRQPTEGE